MGYSTEAQIDWVIEKWCENYEEKDLFVYIPACDPWSEGAPLHSCQLSAPKVESTTCRKCRTNLERQQFQRKLYFKHYLNYAITLPGSKMRNSKPWLNHVLGSTCESWFLRDPLNFQDEKESSTLQLKWIQVNHMIKCVDDHVNVETNAGLVYIGWRMHDVNNQHQEWCP